MKPSELCIVSREISPVQGNAFLLAITAPEAKELRDAIVDYVADNFEPGSVYDCEDLRQWALANGFTETTRGTWLSEKEMAAAPSKSQEAAPEPKSEAAANYLFISCDLAQPELNYEEVRKAVRALGECQELQHTLFCVHTECTPEQVYARLAPSMDVCDSLAVFSAGASVVSRWGKPPATELAVLWQAA